MVKVSILICSHSSSKHLSNTMQSIAYTFPVDKFDLEILIDSECKRTGLANTTRRYMELFKKSSGDIIVKSDDDVIYYPGWFEQCYEAIKKDSKIGYISPISHSLMKKIGVRHACDKKIPIEPNGNYSYEDIASGMCWVFKRDFWNKIPYSNITVWQIDHNYSRMVIDKGFKIASLQGALISHAGQDRWKGIPSDTPGKPPSKMFIERNPKLDFRVF